jgi:hypothetical protein
MRHDIIDTFATFGASQSLGGTLGTEALDEALGRVGEAKREDGISG